MSAEISIDKDGLIKLNQIVAELKSQLRKKSDQSVGIWERCSKSIKAAVFPWLIKQTERFKIPVNICSELSNNLEKFKKLEVSDDNLNFIFSIAI